MNIRKYLGAWIYDEKILLGEQFNFGHREVLLATNGLSRTSLIRASVPHGWGEGTNNHVYPEHFNKFGKAFPILSWSDRTTLSYKNKGYKNVSTTGSPWAHLLKAVEKKPVQAESKTDSQVTYFPTHSIPGGTVSHLLTQEMCNRLNSFGEVTVCLFWLDFVNPKTHTYYIDMGFKVICVGFKGNAGYDSPWAPVGGRVSFLPNLLELFKKTDVVVVDTVSTTFWYSLSLRKKTVILSENKSSTWWGNHAPLEIVSSNKDILASVDSSLAKFDLSEPTDVNDFLYETAIKEIGLEETQNFLKFIEGAGAMRDNVIDSAIIEPMCDYLESASFSR